MKMFVNLIILAMVCGGAVLLYQQLDSMGPESEPQSLSAAQTETAVAETKPATPETLAQPAPAETPATTTAATPAAPATPAPSTEPAAQPAAQPAAPVTAMVEQPTAPATMPAPAATIPATPVTPEKPAAPVAEQPPAPAATAQAATPTPAVAPLGAAAVPPAPAASAPMPQPPAAVQVATATPPPAPAPAAPAEPQKKLAELTQDDLLSRLPVNARMGYRTARAAAESRGDMMGMRSWFSQWRRYLADPMRAVLEVDMAKLLIQSKASYPNEAAAKAAQRGNANEARMLISGIMSRRINNAELSEMVDKVRQDVDRELEQAK